MPSVDIIIMSEQVCKGLDQGLHWLTLEVCVFEEIEIPLRASWSRMHELLVHRYWHDTLDTTSSA
jgi:hypothetical protein